MNYLTPFVNHSLKKSFPGPHKYQFGTIFYKPLSTINRILSLGLTLWRRQRIGPEITTTVIKGVRLQFSQVSTFYTTDNNWTTTSLRNARTLQGTAPLPALQILASSERGHILIEHDTSLTPTKNRNLDDRPLHRCQGTSRSPVISTRSTILSTSLRK